MLSPLALAVLLDSIVSSEAMTGFSECPCIDTTIGEWKKLFATQVITHSGREWIVSSTSSFPHGGNWTVLRDYGSGLCKKWDEKSVSCQARVNGDIFNEASGALLENTPAWCTSLWCYVDPNECPFQKPRESGLFPGLYYSYETCGNRNQYDADDLKFTKKLLERKIRVSYPSGGWPGIMGPEEWASSRQAVSFGHDMLLNSGGREEMIVRKNVSEISSSKYSSSFTACTHDVALGLTDMCMGDFWETSERRLIAPFSSSFSQEHIYLLSRMSGDNSIEYFMRKPFQPFSDELWGLIIGIVLVTGIVFAIFDHSANTEDFNDRRGPAIVVKSFYLSIMGCVGGGVAHTPQTTPSRVVGIGYGFFLLIVLASFTANTTTFLVASATKAQVESLEDAIMQRKRVCVESALVSSLVDQSPKVEPLLLVHEEAEGITEAVGKGGCDLTILGDWTLLTLRSDNKFCDYAAVGKPVLSIPIVFPVQSDLVVALSWAVTQYRSTGGWAKAQRKYPFPASECPTEGDDADTDSLQLKPKDMLGICIVMVLFWSLAGVVYCIGKGAGQKKLSSENEVDESAGELSTRQSIEQLRSEMGEAITASQAKSMEQFRSEIREAITASQVIARTKSDGQCDEETGAVSKKKRVSV